MAKRIVSLLCAFALLVTMVSIIATFTASAATVTANLLDGTHIGNWSVNRSGVTTGANFSGNVNMTNYSGWTTKYSADDDITGMLLVHLYSNPTGGDSKRKVTFTYSDPIALGDDFSVFMTPYSRARSWETVASSRDSYVGLQLGDYTFNFTRVKTDRGTSGNYSRYCLIVSKSGAELGRTLVTSNEAGASFNGAPFMTRYLNDLTVTTSDFVQSSGTNYGGANTHWRTQCPSGAGSPAGGMRGLACTADTVDNASFRDYTISVSSGVLTIKDVNGDVVGFDTDGDGTEDVTSFAVSAGDFSSVTPVVTCQGDDLSKDKNPMGMMRLTVTTKVTAATVELDANGGQLSGNSTLELAEGNTLPTLPTPTRNWAEFIGWFDAAVGGNQKAAGDAWTDGETLYAHWDYHGRAILNANGGSVSVSAVELAAGGVLPDLPTPERSMCVFDGWFTAADGGDQKVAGDAWTDGETLYAHWTDNAPYFHIEENNITPNGVDSNANYTAHKGYFTTSTYGAGFYNFCASGTSSVSLGEDLDMASFTLDSILWTTAEDVASGGIKFVLTVGDLEIDFTRNDQWTPNMSVTGSYQGNALTFSSGAFLTSDNGTLMFTADTKAVSKNLFAPATGRGFYSYGAQVTHCYYVRVSYVDGTLTISTPYVRNGISEEARYSIYTTNGGQGMTFKDADVSWSMIHNLSGNRLSVITTCGGVYTNPSPFEGKHVGRLYINESTAIQVGYDKDTFEGIDNYANLTVVPSIGTTTYDALTPVLDGNNEYSVLFDRITPNLFATNVTFALKDGDTVIDTFGYSVKQYCASKIGGADAELSTLCQNILMYGAATATYLNESDNFAAITADIDFTGVISTPDEPEAYTSPTGTGILFSTAALNLRENISLVIKMNAADIPADGLLYCTGNEVSIVLTTGAATIDGNVATYVIPVGIQNAYTDCEIVMKNGQGEDVSKVYTLSVAKIAGFYRSNSNANVQNLGTAILCYAKALSNYLAA